MPKKIEPLLRRPGPNSRMMIVGRTGSGKTVAALSHLANSDFDQKPWVMVNSKGDENINAIRGAIEWDIESPAPRKPGLYTIRPLPDVDDAELKRFLWRIHAQENVGLYIDEGYMVAPKAPINSAMRAILTQGRSKNIPVIINSQRPSWIDPFIISEADFYQVFHLNDKRDKKRIQEFIPNEPAVILGQQSSKFDLEQRLEPYHSIYYDVGSDTGKILRPLRPAEQSIELIDQRLDIIRKTDNTIKRISV